MMRLSIICGVTLLMGATVWANDASTIPYRVRFSGVSGPILNEMKSVSDALALRQRPPISERQLRRRAERDIPRFQQILQAHGHFDAAIDLRLRMDRSPARVEYRIEMGEPYRLRHIGIEPEPGTDDFQMPRVHALGFARGVETFTARSARRGVHAITQHLERNGFPFARVTLAEVAVDHAEHAVDLRYRYETGPAATFGETTFTGLVSVRESFVRAQAPWQEGAPFDGALLRDAQRRWSGAGLFAAVRIERADQLDEHDALPLQVWLSERKHRSISLGVGYATDEGARARATWENRNVFEQSERLALSWAVTEIGYSTEALLQKPDFRRLDQTLSLSLRAALDETDAYRSRNVGGLTSIDRRIKAGLVLGGGLGFRYASVRDIDDQIRFGLVYVPLRMDRDTSDNLLDPRQGGRWSLAVAPYRDVIGRDIQFYKLRANAARYVRIGRRPEVDLAGRITLASVLGEERENIPADERLYAGGGGTIRGYAFQSVGPLEDKTPIGGRSLAVTAAELRWRINTEFGLVAFIDGGTAFENETFGGGEEWRWGTGAGFRYFTPVGPLRFDLAFPLDRRSGIDDPYQFYISLGQAF